MKVDDKIIGSVKQVGVDTSMDYQVATNAKVMRMFSDKIYSYKIRAVIRELSTNAWDAHIQAGNTDNVPTIHLPNAQNNEFYIRDYGTGMSREEMERVYRRYGISTKTDSNDLNGQMGIGSKSPFAYTNAFTTTSFYNGKKYTYINAKKEDGSPVLHYMGESDTDEPNGLMVSLVVEDKDFNEFYYEAQSVLMWFPNPFKVVSSGISPYFKLKEYSYNKEIFGEDWKIRASYGSYAIMGFVEYPIDINQFKNKKTDRPNDWYQHYGENNVTNLLDCGFELHFDIGEIDMDTSRERLSYTTKTIDAINKKLLVIYEEIASQVQNRIASASNKWEARIVLNTLKRGLNSKIFKLIDNNHILFNNEALTDISFKELSDTTGVQVKELYYGKTKNKWGYTTGRKQMLRSIDDLNEIKPLQASENVIFFLDDMNVGGMSSVSRFVDDKLSSNEWDDPQYGSSNIPNMYLIKCKDDQEVAAAANYIGCDVTMFVPTSTLPKLKRKSRATEYGANSVFTLSSNNYQSNMSSWWTSIDDDNFDFDAGGVFVEINNYKAVVNSQGFAPWLVGGDIKILKSLGIRVPVIYGVKTASLKPFEKARQWTCYSDWLNHAVRTYVKNRNLTQRLIARERLSQIKNSVSTQKLLNIAEIHKLDNSLINQLSKVVYTNTVLNNGVQRVVNQLQEIATTSVDIPKINRDKIDTVISDLNNKIFEKYELLEYVVNNQVSMRYEDTDKIVNYINLVDSVSSS